MIDRMQLRPWTAAVAVLLALTAAGACKKKEPAPAPAPQVNMPAPAPAPMAAPAAVQVSDIRLGNAIGDDKNVTMPAESFAPTDTVYASVTTTGDSPASTLRAHWTFEDGQTVADDSRTVATSGTAITEFHVSQPGGLPAGNYKLEVFVDTTSAGTRYFTVR